MNTSVKHSPARAEDISFTDTQLVVLLEDGREISVPLEWYPKLRDASKEDLNNWRLIGDGIGIHWDRLDEDLSIEGLLK